jgi:hypothetical protein
LAASIGYSLEDLSDLPAGANTRPEGDCQGY